MLGIRSFSQEAMLSLIPLVCLACCLNGCAGPVIQSSFRNKPEENAIGYYLPKGLIRLVVNPKADSKNPQQPDYEITFSNFSVPDTKYLYTLKYLPKATADDEVNIQLGSNGLLKSITTTTIDKMPEVIQKIATLVPTALKQAIPAADASRLKLTQTVKKIDVIFDPDGDIENLKASLNDVGVGLEVNLLSADKEKIFVEPVDSTSSHSVYYRLFVPYQVSVTFAAATTKDTNSSSPPLSSPLKAHGVTRKTHVANKPTDTPSPTGQGYYKVSTILYVPNQHSPILSCDIKRAAFVRKTTTLTFADGVLTGSVIAKPSEVVGFMSIPLDIATAIVAVPGSIVKFRIDKTTQEKALVDAQNKLVDMQNKLIETQMTRIKDLQSLEKAKQGGTENTNSPQ